jgi:hypothetical protein
MLEFMSKRIYKKLIELPAPNLCQTCCPLHFQKNRRRFRQQKKFKILKPTRKALTNETIQKYKTFVFRQQLFITEFSTSFSKSVPPSAVENKMSFNVESCGQCFCFPLLRTGTGEIQR